MQILCWLQKMHQRILYRLGRLDMRLVGSHIKMSDLNQDNGGEYQQHTVGLRFI